MAFFSLESGWQYLQYIQNKQSGIGSNWNFVTVVMNSSTHYEQIHNLFGFMELAFSEQVSSNR